LNVHDAVIGLTCFAIHHGELVGGVRYPKGIPAVLVAIIVGTAIAWARTWSASTTAA